MKTLQNLLNIAALLILSATTVLAAQASAYDLPAVGGYDLVSYHQDDGPVRGSGFQKAEHGGITYLFANETNKAAFEAKPKKFLPEFNGYCAYGVAVGQKFNTDPTIYELVDGKLYLNLNADIQKKWSEDKAANIQKAHTNWKTLQ